NSCPLSWRPEATLEETEDSILSPIPMGPPSPFPTSEDFTPKEGSPYEAPVYIPEDIPIPPDFELRESSIPGAGLGIWAKRKMEVGERLGPCVAAPRAALKEADFGWEVSILSLSMIDHGHLSCVQSIFKAREQPLPEAGGSVGRRERSNVTFPRVILSCSFHDATQKTSAGLADACQPQ
uniref:PR domain zinc finger protein 16 n=1 Tax=Spermophilus dauricus TaxID=99837 RepID=A0A8C9QRM8_SPEDA